MGATVIIVGVAIFAIGAVAGIFALTSLSIKREERDFRRTGRISMTRLAPNRISHGTRGLVGLYVRQRMDLDPAAATLYEDTLV
jgi:hypothetical protein